VRQGTAARLRIVRTARQGQLRNLPDQVYVAKRSSSCPKTENMRQIIFVDAMDDVRCTR
jgi:hypothetical protein